MAAQSGQGAGYVAGETAIARAMWRILPLLGLGYLVAYMDRVNVSFAALRMNADLGFSATVYGLGGGLFFLGYALFEVPSNLMLARYGARRWIARIMLTWGVLAIAMAWVRTPVMFYVLRFLLGTAEAGFLPGVICYLTGWFPSRWRGRAISRFYVAGSLAGIAMGAVSGAIMTFDGSGLAGWQWLFVLQGLPALAVAGLILRFLPDRPGTVRWLDEPARDWLEHELAAETAAIDRTKSTSLLALLANRVVLGLGLFGALTIGASMTLALSLPQLLRAETQAGLLWIGWIVSIGDALAAIGVLTCGVYTDRRGERWTVLLVSTATTALALALLAATLGHSAPLFVAAFLLFKLAYSFVSSASVMLWTDLLNPHELTIGAAAMNTMCQLGAFVMPFAWGVARDASGGFRAGLLGLTLVAFAALGLAMVLARVLAARPAFEPIG